MRTEYLNLSESSESIAIDSPCRLATQSATSLLALT